MAWCFITSLRIVPGLNIFPYRIIIVLATAVYLKVLKNVVEGDNNIVRVDNIIKKV